VRERLLRVLVKVDQPDLTGEVLHEPDRCLIRETQIEIH